MLKFFTKVYLKANLDEYKLCSGISKEDCKPWLVKNHPVLYWRDDEIVSEIYHRSPSCHTIGNLD